jgi:hypothetical protein
MPRFAAIPSSQSRTPPVKNVPGETVLTRIPSGASVFARFLLRLVTALFASAAWVLIDRRLLDIEDPRVFQFTLLVILARGKSGLKLHGLSGPR